MLCGEARIRRSLSAQPNPSAQMILPFIATATVNETEALLLTTLSILARATPKRPAAGMTDAVSCWTAAPAAAGSVSAHAMAKQLITGRVISFPSLRLPLSSIAESGRSVMGRREAVEL